MPAEPLLEDLWFKGPAPPPVVRICEVGCPSCAQASGIGCQKDKRKRRSLLQRMTASFALGLEEELEHSGRATLNRNAI